jgi:acetamidase/formamidase
VIDHLQIQGLTYQLAYTLCSAVVDLRISQTVEVPNLLASALLPRGILCVAPRTEPAGGVATLAESAGRPRVQ